MKGLSSDRVAFLDREDIDLIKGKYKRIMRKTGQKGKLEEPEGTYKTLCAISAEMVRFQEVKHLMSMCVILAGTKTNHEVLERKMVKALTSVVSDAIKEIDAYEEYSGR